MGECKKNRLVTCECCNSKGSCVILFALRHAMDDIEGGGNFPMLLEGYSMGLRCNRLQTDNDVCEYCV